MSGSKAAIYYFSGSGNSLVVARALAQRLEARLISIASVMSGDIVHPEADVIGIVFPVYFATNGNGGVPLIVERFLGKLEGIGPKYVFAVCTHGGGPGSAIEHFGDLITARGGRLAAGFGVRMGAPAPPAEKITGYLSGSGKIRNADTASILERHRPVYEAAAKKLDAICEYVKDRREGTYETRGALQKLLNAPLLLLAKPLFRSRYRKLSGSSSRIFSELVPGADRGFTCGDQCNGCGICAKVCPVDNIRMADRRPVWQHRCENCLACFVWCPRAAIGGELVAYNERYHHPGVRLTDMVTKSESPASKASTVPNGTIRPGSKVSVVKEVST
jgi:ferredoxin/flavodoxin